VIERLEVVTVFAESEIHAGLTLILEIGEEGRFGLGEWS
jgi:hypothetical protein